MKYKKKGTPKGYKHIWGYKGVWKEKKITPKKWRIDFKATKGKSAKGYGNFKKGFKVLWKINARQEAVKTSKGTYQTHLYGTKTLLRTGRVKNKLKRRR